MKPGSFERLIEPSAAVTAVEERERARLLAALLLVVVAFGAVTTALQVALVPDFFPATFARVAAALALLAAAYVASRTRAHRVAALVTVAVPLLTAALQGYAHPADVSWWAFMALSPLFATMFLPTRAAGVVAALTALTTTAVLLATRAQLSQHAWAAPLAFHLIYGPLLIAAAAHRTRLERKRREEASAKDAQLAEARRMEAVGRLAGGIAHDFNNLLTVVMANAAVVEARATTPDDRQAAREIQTAGERAAALTRQLLAFAKRQPRSARPLDLVRVVDELVPMIRRLLGEAVRFDVLRPARAAVVLADATQMEQVVMNLVANARDAMPQGGTLTLAISLEATAAGEAVVLAVRDTGRGMDEETRVRVFEPFFTTRLTTGGTGLGLATTRSIVEQCHGTIAVESAPGKGSEFRVELPLCGETPPPPEPAAAAPAVAAPLRVLLVEDDDAIRRTLSRALEAKGLAVTAARSADEALEAAQRLAFDALVTDVVMPGLRGPELAARLREQRPGLPVVFISGYHDDGGALGEDATTAVLGKPLTAEALLRELAELTAKD